MRSSSSSHGHATFAATLLGVAAFNAVHAAGPANLLINGGFEKNRGVGTIPDGWEVFDEYFEYFGWIAPRTERMIGDVGPRTGRYMVGLDTAMMAVNTNDKEYHIPRAAIFQTITLPAGASGTSSIASGTSSIARGTSAIARGTFSIYYNDLHSTALAHLSAIRLAYTVNSTEIGKIKFPAQFITKPAVTRLKPGVWSNPFFRVSQKLPRTQTAVGDWSLASIGVAIPAGGSLVKLTLWIGIFDHQNSTELGYWRIDDASFTLDRPATTRPAQ